MKRTSIILKITNRTHLKDGVNFIFSCVSASLRENSIT